MCDLILIF